MKVATWGDGLAIRLPEEMVAARGLKDGDDVDVDVRLAADRTLEVLRDARREEALARLKAMRRVLPADFRFDREEANAR